MFTGMGRRIAATKPTNLTTICIMSPIWARAETQYLYNFLQKSVSVHSPLFFMRFYFQRY